MTQEDKELLLQDLSARLPYGVMCNIGLKYPLQLQRIFVDRLDGILLDFYEDGDDYQVYLSEVKPYLRPMSSMTEEEKKEYNSFLFDNLEREDVIGYEDKAFGIDVIMRYRSWEVIQWLLEHHLDFNGLIDVYGLALEAPEGMYR